MKKSFVVLISLFVLSSCGAFVHGAAKYNDLERIKTYVAEGHVNDREEIYQHTPLMVATYYGHVEIAQYLCENGADLDAQAIDGSTALIYSACLNYPQITQILLSNRASVNLKDKQGHTALYYADQYRFYRVAELLTRNGGLKQ